MEPMPGNSHPTAPALLQSIGVLILFFAFMTAMGAFFAPKDGHFGLRFDSFQVVERFIATMVTMVIFGVGLLLLQKWAASLLSLAGIWGALLSVGESLRDLAHPTSDSLVWPGLLFAAVLIVPAVVTAYSWKHLVWWKRLPPNTKAG